jgi:hypothetical protein
MGKLNPNGMDLMKKEKGNTNLGKNFCRKMIKI